MGNKGGNVRKGLGMRVQKISMGMRGIWVEIGKMWGISVAMQGIKMET